jgi:hypothetical protein
MDNFGGISAIAAGVTAVVAGMLLAAFFAPDTANVSNQYTS